MLFLKAEIFHIKFVKQEKNVSIVAWNTRLKRGYEALKELMKTKLNK